MTGKGTLHLIPARWPSVRRFRFATFELDVELGELVRAGVKQPLHGQPLQVLELLLSSPGELVSREQLRRALWPDGTIVEFDDSLNNCVRRLRQALGDDATRPTFIETIPRRGYRFLAEVTAETRAGPPGRGPGGTARRALRRSGLSAAATPSGPRTPRSG